MEKYSKIIVSLMYFNLVLKIETDKYLTRRMNEILLTQQL